MGVAHGSEKYTKGREKFEIISGIFGYKVVDYHSSLEVTCSRECADLVQRGKKAVISTRRSIDTTERIIMRKEIILNEKHPSPTVIIISILH